MACPTRKCCPADYEHFNLACWSPSPNVGVDFTRFLAWVAKVACEFKLDLQHESLKNIMFGYICKWRPNIWTNIGLQFGCLLLVFGSHYQLNCARRYYCKCWRICVSILINQGRNCKKFVVRLLSLKNWRMKHYNLAYLIHLTTYRN
jgi:hypothetical protein